MAFRPSTRLRTAALGAACAGVTLVGIAGSSGSVPASATPAGAHQAGAHQAGAHASAQPPVVAGSRYLALGDSVSFGYREANAIPVSRNNYNKPATFIGYPEDVAKNLGLKVENLACPGETSASLINPRRASNGCENRYDPTTKKQVKGGYRTAYPLHVKYHGSQLAAGVRYLRTHRNVRLVSLMIGANDGFLCEEKTSDGCVSELGATLAKIGKNVTHILKAVRTKGHYTGQIVIVQYYSTDYTSALGNAESQALNSAVADAAKPFHVRVAKAYSAFKKASAQAHGKTCAAQLLTQLKTTPASCGVHPSVAGQALLAQSVEQAIKK